MGLIPETLPLLTTLQSIGAIKKKNHNHTIKHLSVKLKTLISGMHEIISRSFNSHEILSVKVLIYKESIKYSKHFDIFYLPE